MNNLYKKISNISYLMRKFGKINQNYVKIILIKIIKNHMKKMKIKILEVQENFYQVVNKIIKIIKKLCKIKK